jgi:two-component sensor histidine kinase/DNA-binding NarL/FixJ family response regulator/GAF domain-containing protein
MNGTTPLAGPTAVSIEQLDELLSVADQMLQHVFSDRKRSLGEAANLVGQLLGAENASIFLVTEEGSDLELAASVNQLLQNWDTPTKSRWHIEASPHAGFTSNLAAKQEAVNYSFLDLKASDFASGKELIHLRDRRRYSLLVVPLFYRKKLPDGRRILLGLLKCENKLGESKNSSPEISFSEWDFQRAIRMAQKIVAVIENLEVFEVLAGLLRDVHEKRGRDELDKSVLVLKAIIERVTRLVRATRGDFAWREVRMRELVFAARSGGPSPGELAPNDIVPGADKSFVRAVFVAKGVDFRKMNDVTKERDQHPYYPAAPNIRSELAVRVDFSGSGPDFSGQAGTPIGVINVESEYPGWFDDRDVEVLRLIARHSALAIQLVRSEALMRRAFERKESPQVILTAILDTVIEICGFDEGIVYRCGVLPGDDVAKLIPIATRHSGPITGDEAKDFGHSLDRPQSFAAWVFNHGVGWAAPDDPRVSQGGRAKWGIDRPMFGCPLKVENETVGVFILWTRGREHPAGEKFEVKRLEPFARLAAAVVGLDDAERELRESERKYRSLVNGFPIRFLVKRSVPWDRPKPSELMSDNELKDGPMLIFDYANDDLLNSFNPKKRLDDFLFEIVGEIKRPATDWTWFKDQALSYYRDDLTVIRTGKPLSRKEPHNASAHSGPRQVRVWKAPVTDEHGRIVGVRCVFWDRHEEQRQEDLKELLLHELPHRLRRCLRHVGAFLDLESRRSDIPEVKHVLRDSQLRIQTMETVQNILGRDPLLPEVRMDEYLRELVPKVISSFRGEDSPTVRLELSGIQPVTFPYHLAFQTGLIVTELVSNSMNHAFSSFEADGTINSLLNCTVTVSLNETSKDQFKLQVMDNGVGLKRSEDRSSDNLGLKMVDTLVRNQWGSFPMFCPSSSVTGNDTPDRPGTCFIVSFPRRATVADGSIPAIPRKQALPKILIIEDDVVPDGMQCEWLLRSYAYEVLPIITTKNEAIEAVEKWKPDAIVMDIELRGERDAGLSAAKEIREKSHIPIVFLTGRTKEEVAPEVALIHNTGIVMKGTNIEDNLIAQLYVLFAKSRTGNKVFICYSHENDQQHARLKKTLSMPPLAKLGPTGLESKIWDDDNLQPGDHWFAEIDTQLRQAVAGILLVSEGFLLSEFIQKNEFPDLLQRATERGTRILPIGIEKLPREALEASGLSRFHFVLESDKDPTSKSRKREKDVFNAAFQQVLKAVNSAGTMPP